MRASWSEVGPEWAKVKRLASSIFNCAFLFWGTSILGNRQYKEFFGRAQGPSTYMNTRTSPRNHPQDHQRPKEDHWLRGILISIAETAYELETPVKKKTHFFKHAFKSPPIQPKLGQHVVQLWSQTCWANYYWVI